MVSYLAHYDTLLWNAADVITKCDIKSLKNESSFLLQNETVSLQNVTVLIKCDSYYKMRCLLQNVSVQGGYGTSERCTAWKLSKYRVFYGPYFPLFGLNMEIYGVDLRIQSECRKIWTKKMISRLLCKLVNIP